MAVPTFPAACVRGALAEARISRLELARIAGLSPDHVSKILNERLHPGPITVRRLQLACERLEIDIPQLMATDPLAEEVDR